MSDQMRELWKKAKAQDFQALAKLLSEIDRIGAMALRYPEMLDSSVPPALRIGLTGPPGAGKSTLTGGILRQLRRRNLRVGVLAVDPSSPFSRGAVLADRIRYNEQSLDPGVFIRSLASRGSLGGLSAAAFLFARVMDGCGFDVVLIETVGVGQTDFEIMHAADVVTLVLVPESGDSVQIMKAGILEIANVIVVNKADRPGAQGLLNELQAVQATAGERAVQVCATTATSGEGVAELTERLIADLQSRVFVKARTKVERLRSEAQALLRFEMEGRCRTMSESISSWEDFVGLFADERLNSTGQGF